MAPAGKLPFDPRSTLTVGSRAFTIFSLAALEGQGLTTVSRLPYSIRILLENVLRGAWLGIAGQRELTDIASWSPGMSDPATIPFMPSRVLLQDFTGVPSLVDLAAMRSALARAGGDPSRINPRVPADLIIDHSVQVDRYGSPDAFSYNMAREMERNRERYSLLRWGQEAFDDFRVVPPGTGICHQVNLEYLGTVVRRREIEGDITAYPDTLVGTDSHTPMINSLGVLGWGVGGIEAESVLLGQPYYMLVPEVVGMKLTGSLPAGTTATDLVLTLTEMLREKGVVGRFVEFFGPGLSSLSVPDRATISNMSPEYGATTAFFPVDEETLTYLSATGRRDLVGLVEGYTKDQSLFHSGDSPKPDYTVVYGVNLSTVEPSLAGPRKPHERVPLPAVKDYFLTALHEMTGSGVTSNADSFGSCGAWAAEGGSCALTPEGCRCPMPPRSEIHQARCEMADDSITIGDGAVVIAAITSCTNTSNPSVMIGAGLLARNATERGLTVKPWVKTSLAPGSRVVTDYLDRAGLTPHLEALGFNLVGYGCTTCIGNSGPLDERTARTIENNQLVTAAVLSGNRNYEARIHPYVRANFLASPLLVIAYALAGVINIDLASEPVCYDPDGDPVYLREIWPSEEEIRSTVESTLKPEMFAQSYADVFTGDDLWNGLAVPHRGLFRWNPESTYIREPPFFQDMPVDPPPGKNIQGARILAIFGDTLTTDHISPAGVIPADSPAGRYLISSGVDPADFNSFGSRRGNHEVLLRGTFANIRIRNRMVDGEGGWTVHHPSGEIMTIYDAAMRYREDGVPLVVFGGREYGAGSSRDWAAKGVQLLGVRAVLAESFERIHRSNLVGMGVLPIQLAEGSDVDSLDLAGNDIVTIEGLDGGMGPGQKVTVIIESGGRKHSFEALARLDNHVEAEYYRHGGILHKVLREMMVNQESGARSKEEE
ncbi:MAG: aconitate hydratase AcnA [bacterium]|nr:MAG: aconitate hydratase AcnA [bacterium]